MFLDIAKPTRRHHAMPHDVDRHPNVSLANLRDMDKRKATSPVRNTESLVMSCAMWCPQAARTERVRLATCRHWTATTRGKRMENNELQNTWSELKRFA